MMPSLKTRLAGARTVRHAAIVLPVLALAGCQEAGLLAPAGDVAARQSAHLMSIFLWMLVVIVPLLVALPIIVWRYRLGGRGRFTPDWEFSLPLECLIWGVPAVVVVVLSWNLWTETLEMDPYRPVAAGEVLRIDAVGYDWKWLFVYPEQGIAVADRLVLPVGRNVELRLTSATALQSFSIPRLGGQIYAMPGMATRFNLRAAQTGGFEGLNTQYNGEGFARQRFTAEVVTDADFAAWVETARAAPPLDDPALAELAKRSVLDEPRAYGTLRTDPFARALAPGHAAHGAADHPLEAAHGAADHTPVPAGKAQNDG